MQREMQCFFALTQAFPKLEKWNMARYVQHLRVQHLGYPTLQW